jgi:hypothetical protein
MVVSPDFADGVIYDFKEKSKEIIDAYSLSHLRGTAAMDPVSRLGEEFIKLAQGSTTSQTMTESMLESEKRLYLRTIEQKVLEVSRNQSATLNGIASAHAKQAPIKDANWDRTITSVAREVDRIAMKNADLVNMLPKEQQQVMDGMFSTVVDQVRFKHSRDPSAESSMLAEKAALKELRKVESHLEKVSKNTLKAKQDMIYNDFNEQLRRYMASFAQLRKAMKPQEVKATNAHISSIKAMIREIKTNRRLVSDEELLKAHIGALQDQFRILNDMEGSVSETVSAVAGIFGSTHRRTNKTHFALDGFGAMVSAQEIANKHPERTNPAHIRSMQYFMNQGQTFEEAHESAIAYGFEPDGGVMAMDLDRRVNYLGQVPVTDATAASHTIKENSDFVKGLTSGGTLLGLGTVLAIGSVVGLVVISSR